MLIQTQKWYVSVCLTVIILSFTATFQTVILSILALGLHLLSHSCSSSCFWDGYGLHFSTEDWIQGCVSFLAKFFNNTISITGYKNWTIPWVRSLFYESQCLHYVFNFLQIVHHKTRQENPGRSQSQGTDKGRLQKTRAHKVRTCVCLEISCNRCWM